MACGSRFDCFLLGDTPQACRNVAEYAAAAAAGKYTPETKFGWAPDDGSGNQVLGNSVAGTGVFRRKFGKVLKLAEAGLLADFRVLPGHVERDGIYTDIFDAKYFEPTFEAKPFMATFDTNQPVNEGGVFRQVLLCLVCYADQLIKIHRPSVALAVALIAFRCWRHMVAMA